MSISDQGAARAPIPELLAIVDSPKVPIAKRQRVAGLIVVLLVAVLPLIVASVFAARGVDTNLSDSSIRYRYFTLLLREASSLALLAYVVRQNGQLASDFGLVFRFRDIVYGILLWVAALCAYRLAFPTVLTVCELLGWHRSPAYLPSLRLGMGLLTYCFVLVNPFFEEMVVRAFLMSETIALTGSSFLAIVLSTLLQTSYHIYQGIPFAMGAGVIFLLFSVYYARTRHIMPVILAHFIWDFWAQLAHVTVR